MTFRDRVASISVISAPNSTIVEGTNMLIGGLLKLIVHRSGWVRSILNCVTLASLAASLAWTSYVGFAMFSPPFAFRICFFAILLRRRQESPYLHSPVTMCTQG